MEYVFITLLLLGSAFFSGTEIAYTSLSKLKIKKDSENLTATQKLVRFIYNHYDYALSTVLIGNNLVNIAATSMATVIALNLAASMGGKISDDAASTIVTVVMTTVILIVGEITPKMIARRCNETFAKLAAYPLLVLMILFFPAVYITSGIVSVFSRLWKKEDVHEVTITEEEFENGTVCWLLNDCSEKNPVWYQTLGRDSSPLLDDTHGVVICKNGTYTNLEGNSIVNGISKRTFVDVYDIRGRLVRKATLLHNCLEGLPHGVYIVNGKKIVH